MKKNYNIDINYLDQYIHYERDGIITSQYYKMNGKYHRENKPARIDYYENGNIELERYFINGELHRENGPAIIHYYNNGNVKSQYYYINNKLHREDGPATICYDEKGNVELKHYYVGDSLINLEKYTNINYDKAKKSIVLRKNINSLLQLKLIVNIKFKNQNKKNELCELIDSKILMIKLTNN